VTSPTAARLGQALADRYRIERELGAGGMATVYLAQDLRHDREVAIKVLHPDLGAALGGDRFLSEIKTTAKLQHPHILPLLDSGTADSLLFYVMPYVRGQTLRTRLTRERQLPLEDALRISREVADALGAAHGLGIIHRDIKPENILLQGGHALVADFGIALAVQHAGGQRMTQTGLSLGTPQYMSPEQAMGERTIDARSDIYALGAVTYEMLAGDPPFTGSSVQAIIAKVLSEKPTPLSTLRDTVPPGVEGAVLKALAKLPADRFTSATEFAAALSRPESGTFTSARVTTTGPGSRWGKARTGLGLAPWALAVAGLGLAAWALTRPVEIRHHPVVQYSMAPPESQRIIDAGGSPAVIRPDGTGFVYVGASPGRPRQLFRWQFDGSAPVPIAGTDNAMFPFISPDGAWIGFLSAGEIRKVGIDGGGASTIGSVGLAVGSFRGATWTTRNRIVFSTSLGLQELPAEGGTVQPLFPNDPAGQAVFFPEALPDGDHVVVAVLNSTRGSGTELGIVSLETGELTPLGLQGSNPAYVDPGFLAFTTTDGALHAVRFDPGRRRIQGESRPIAQGLALGTAGVGKLDVARNGTIAYVEGAGVEERQLVRVDRRGLVRELDAPPRSYNGPRISPDGRRIAVTVGAVPNPPMDLWVYHLVQGSLTRVTYDSTSVHGEWSRDGGRLYHRRARGGYRAMATAPDGSAPPESLYATEADLWEVLPTPSGDTIITRELRSIETDRDLMLVPLRTGGTPIPWAAGPRIQAEPALSPDGRWLAYTSDESGNSEVYIRAFPGPGPRYPVSTATGKSPRWNPRGGEIFYLSTDSLIAVPVQQKGATLEIGRGRALFANRFADLNFHAPYDIAPDGTWFVFVGFRGRGGAIAFRLVHNWFDQPWK